MYLTSYLTFNGNCREAMLFYKACLGGVLRFQTIGESPLAEKLPEEMKNRILHASLRRDSLCLLASDIVSEKGLIKGNSVSLSLQCTSKEEINNCYAKLAAHGTANHPLETSFWGALFGDLTDQFGHHWILNYNKNVTP